MAANSILVQFLNGRIRPMGDRLAGLLPLPNGFLKEFEAKGIGELLGIPDKLLTQAEPLTLADYGSVSGEPIDDGRAGDGSVPLSPRDVLIFYRVVRFLGFMLDSDPMVTRIAMKIAVNTGS